MTGEVMKYTLAVDTDVSSAIGGVKQLQSALNGVKMPASLSADLMKDFDKLRDSLIKFKTLAEKTSFSKGDLKQMEKLQSEIDSTFSHLSKSISDLSGKTIYLDADLSKIREADAEINKIKADIQNKLSEIKIDLGSSKGKSINLGLDQIVSDMERGVRSSKVLSAAMQEVQQSVSAGNFTAVSQQLNDIFTKAQDLKGASTGLLTVFRQWGLISFEGQAKDLAKTEQGVKLLKEGFNALTSVFNKDEAALQTLSEKLKTLIDKKKDLEATGQKNASDYWTKQAAGADKLADSAHKATQAQKEYTQSVLSTQDQVKQLQQSTQYFFSLRNMINLLKRGLREAVQTIKELDAAMTETAVVTKFSVSDMWAKLPEYTANANALGATIQDMYESTTLYYQQGLNTQQSMQIATETMKMARIAGLEAKDATDMMTAALRGFNMEINEASASHINDVYSNLAANTASNTQELGTAMQRTASIAHSAGMSFEGTAAFLAQAIETTREPAENLGTAMKTIVARFQELKKNPLEIAEVDGEEVSYNKVDTALQSIGVSLKDANGQFRDLDEVFLEISSKWDSLTQVQQRYIATTAAGSRQQSRFIAMMSDYERTMELMGYANNSAGASQEQFSKTLESLEAKLNKFQNAWKEFLMGILNDTWTKRLVDAGTSVLNTVNKIINALSFNGKLSLVKSALSVFTAFTALKFTGRFANKMIGGLGGMIDPTSSFGLGFKQGGVKNSAGQARAISDPIVQAVNRIYNVLNKNAGAERAQQNLKYTGQDSYYKGFVNQQKAFRQTVKNRDTVGEAFNTFKGLDKKQIATILNNNTGMERQLQRSVNKYIENLNIEPATKKLVSKSIPGMFNAFKNDPKMSGEQFLKAFRLDQLGKQLMLGGAKAEGQALVDMHNKFWTDRKDNWFKSISDLTGKEFTDKDHRQQMKENAAYKRNFENYQKRGQETYNQRFGSAGGQKIDDPKLLDKMAQGASAVGAAFSTAGMAITSFGMALSNAGLETIGGLLTKIGTSISGVGNIIASGAMAVSVAMEAGSAAILGFLGAAWPFVAAIAAIVGVAILLDKAIVTNKEALNAAADAATAASDAYDSAKQSASELAEAIEQIRETQSSFDGLVAGTTEFNDQLLKANEQILELIDKYPMLMEEGKNYITTDKNGLMHISEAGLKAVEEYQKAVQAHASATNIIQTADLNALEKQQEAQRLRDSIKTNTSEEDKTRILREADLLEKRAQVETELARKSAIRTSLIDKEIADQEKLSSIYAEQYETRRKTAEVEVNSLDKHETRQRYADYHGYTYDKATKKMKDVSGNEIDYDDAVIKDEVIEQTVLLNFEADASSLEGILNKLDRDFKDTLGDTFKNSSSIISDILSNNAETNEDLLEDILDNPKQLTDFVESLSTKEIAAVLGETESTVENNISGYKKQLEDKLLSNAQNIIDTNAQANGELAAMLAQAQGKNANAVLIDKSLQNGLIQQVKNFTTEQKNTLLNVGRTLESTVGSEAMATFVDRISTVYRSGNEQLISTTQKWVDSVNWETAIGRLKGYNEAIKMTTDNTEHLGEEGVKQINDLGRAMLESQEEANLLGEAFEEFYDSGDFQELAKNMDNFVDSAGQLNAASVMDMAEECSSLNNLLDSGAISAGGVAAALNALNSTGGIAVSDLNSKVLELLSIFQQLDDIIASSHRNIEGFDWGIDTGEAEDFVVDSAKKWNELYDNGEIGNPQMEAYAKWVMGEERYTALLAEKHGDLSATMDEVYKSINKYSDGFEDAWDDLASGSWKNVELSDNLKDLGISASFNDDGSWHWEPGKATTEELQQWLQEVQHIGPELAQAMIEDWSNYSPNFRAERQKNDFEAGLDSYIEGRTDNGKIAITASELQTIAASTGQDIEDVTAAIAARAGIDEKQIDILQNIDENTGEYITDGAILNKQFSEAVGKKGQNGWLAEYKAKDSQGNEIKNSIDIESAMAAAVERGYTSAQAKSMAYESYTNAEQQGKDYYYKGELIEAGQYETLDQFVERLAEIDQNEQWTNVGQAIADGFLNRIDEKESESSDSSDKETPPGKEKEEESTPQKPPGMSQADWEKSQGARGPGETTWRDNVPGILVPLIEKISASAEKQQEVAEAYKNIQGESTEERQQSSKDWWSKLDKLLSTSANEATGYSTDSTIDSETTETTSTNLNNASETTSEAATQLISATETLSTAGENLNTAATNLTNAATILSNNQPQSSTTQTAPGMPSNIPQIPETSVSGTITVDGSSAIATFKEVRNEAEETKSTIETGATFKVTVKSGGLKKAANQATKITKTPSDKNISIKATATGKEDTDALTQAVKNFRALSDKTINLKANASGASDVWSAIAAVKEFYKLQNDEVKITTIKETKVIPEATGSHNHGYAPAPSFGSAARGSYGQVGPKGRGGLTLTGELGYEIAWIPSENRSMILGANGPQMVNLPGDAVVWTHEQSKRIMKQKSIPAGSHSDRPRNLKKTEGEKDDGKSKTPGKGKGKGSQSSTKKEQEKLLQKAGKVVVWWDNQVRKVDKITRNADKNQKAFDKLLKNANSTIKDVTKAAIPTIQQYKKSIKYNEQSLARAKLEIKALDKGTGKTKYTTLKKGSKGSSVKSLQEFLNKETGAKLKTTGSFNGDTQKALKAYQKKKGLKQTGKLDKKTINSLPSKYKKQFKNVPKRSVENGGSWEDISYQVTKKTTKNKKTTTSKVSKEAKVNLANYIKYDKDTKTYGIDQKAIDKASKSHWKSSKDKKEYKDLQAAIKKEKNEKKKKQLEKKAEKLKKKSYVQGNKSKAEAIRSAANKAIDDKNKKRETAEDNIEKAKEALQKIGQDIFDTFYGWKNELTEVYNLTQKIEATEKRISNLKSGQSLIEAQIAAGNDTKGNPYVDFNKASSEYIKLAEGNVKAQVQAIQFGSNQITAKKQAVTSAVNLTNEKATKNRLYDDYNNSKLEREEAKKTLNNLKRQLKNTKDKQKQKQLKEDIKKAEKKYDNAKAKATEAWNTYDAAKTSLKAKTNATKYAKTTPYEDGTVGLDIDYDKLEKDRLAGNITESEYNEIKNYLDSIEEANNNLRDEYDKQAGRLTDLYQSIADLKQQRADEAKELFNQYVENRKQEVENVKTLSNVIGDAFKELIDTVKSDLESRRQIEDNAKTEKDISKKQQRLAALRANTAGGNQVEIAQLQQEIAEAQQSYGRTLEDQLLDKLSQQGDEAQKQREKQIALQEAQVQLATINGTYASHIDWLLANANNKKAKQEMVDLWKQSLGYDGLPQAVKDVVDTEIKQKTLDITTYETQMNALNKAIRTTTTDLATLQTALANAATQVVKTTEPKKEEPKKEEPKKEELKKEEKKITSTTTTTKTTTSNNKNGSSTSASKSGGGGSSSSGSGGKPNFTSEFSNAIASAQSNLTAQSFKNAVAKGKLINKTAGQVAYILAQTLSWKKVLPVVKQADYKEADVKKWLSLVTTNDGKNNFAKAFNTAFNIPAGKGRRLQTNHPETKDSKKKYEKYKQGGLADYTGPAWLDGTPSKPELVLNATDTRNFLALRDVLSKAIGSIGSVDNTYGGDAIYEININVDKLTSDYDVDKVAERVKKIIVKDAGYRNVTQVRNLR